MGLVRDDRGKRQHNKRQLKMDLLRIDRRQREACGDRPEEQDTICKMPKISYSALTSRLSQQFVWETSLDALPAFIGVYLGTTVRIVSVLG